jgi:hypothetical protein
VCSIVIPGGVEVKLSLPEAMGNIFKPKSIQGLAHDAKYMLEQPVWTASNQKITRVYYRKNKSPRPPPLLSKSLPIFEDFLSSDFAEDTACAARKRAHSNGGP